VLNPLLEMPARVEYALLALLTMADHHETNEPLTVSQITALQKIPDRYLEQILINLRRRGLIRSQRGQRGGYSLMKDPWEITLLDIVNSVEGDSAQSGKVGQNKLAGGQAENSTIEKELVYDVWRQAIKASQDVWGKYTLYDLWQKRKASQQTNPMYYI
jgi:Rrf2 family protein